MYNCTRALMQLIKPYANLLNRLSVSPTLKLPKYSTNKLKMS